MHYRWCSAGEKIQNIETKVKLPRVGSIILVFNFNHLAGPCCLEAMSSASPGLWPWREATHCALLSSLIGSFILIATCLLLAASLAAGAMRPTLAKVHIACRSGYEVPILPHDCAQELESFLLLVRQMSAIGLDQWMEVLGALDFQLFQSSFVFRKVYL